MSAFILFFGLPFFTWLWRSEIVSLVSDCIAEGIRKSKERGR